MTYRYHPIFVENGGLGYIEIFMSFIGATLG